LNPAELNPGSEDRLRGQYRRQCLHHNENGDPNAGVKQIKQKILSIDVIDVALVGIGPVRGPDIDELKTVAAILKLWLTLNNYRLCFEGMAVAKVSPELVIRNMAALSRRRGLSRLLFRKTFLLLLLILFLLLLILFLRLGLVLVRFRIALRFHLVLLRLRPGLFLLCGFIVLWLVVLCVDKGRTSDQR
jgi:hypothetical protein